ncbi:MAG: family acetyltransferase, partial [Ilumatobacteraceae bacterium]|nr:family acetyltransferase [Ilumatobacteraceae bacterium]
MALTRAPHLRTARLLVRPWTEADKPGYAALNADPVVMAHFPSTLTAEQSGEMVERMSAAWDLHGFGGWAIERSDDGQFVGMVMLSAPTWTAWFTPCVEVGWRLAQEQWGHGYAPEAAHAVVDWAFAALDALPNDEIVSFTTVQNTNSRRVMEKLGFTHDPADDFDHPLLGDRHEARHVLHRMS